MSASYYTSSCVPRLRGEIAKVRAFGYLFIGVIRRGGGQFSALEGGEGSKGGDLRHEHRAPDTVFSVEAFSQEHFKADCLPQEHLAWEAQTQAVLERPQQVVGTVIVILRVEG